LSEEFPAGQVLPYGEEEREGALSLSASVAMKLYLAAGACLGLLAWLVWRDGRK